MTDLPSLPQPFATALSKPHQSLSAAVQSFRKSLTEVYGHDRAVVASEKPFVDRALIHFLTISLLERLSAALTHDPDGYDEMRKTLRMAEFFRRELVADLYRLRDLALRHRVPTVESVEASRDDLIDAAAAALNAERRLRAGEPELPRPIPVTYPPQRLRSERNDETE